MNHMINRAEVRGALLYITLPKQESKAAPLQGQRKFYEDPTIERPGSGRVPRHGGSRTGGHVLVQIAIIGPADIGESAESLDAGWNQLRETRDDFSSDSISQVQRLGVARVFTIGQAYRVQIRQNLLPPRFVQRAYHGIVADGRHTGKTGQPCPSKHP
jgi:hypothetical protein